MVRLFVGGIPSDVTAAELTQRFTPFGQVAACELVPSKDTAAAPQQQEAHQHGAQQQPLFPPCRGFAYLELQPKDDVSLGRCLSLYNHSKWRGSVLRVEVARPHYLLRLRKEWEQEERRQRRWQRGAAAAANGANAAHGGDDNEEADEGQEEEEEDDDMWWNGTPQPADTSRPMVLVLQRKRHRTKVRHCLLAITARPVHRHHACTMQRRRGASGR